MQGQNLASAKKEWNDETNLAQAQKLKMQGNTLFTQKQYKEALKKYHKAILHLAGIIDKYSAVAMYAKTATKQISLSANTLNFSIWLNMSQIYIYQEKYDKGLEMQFSNLRQRIKKSAKLLESKLPQQKKQKFLPKLFYRQGICYMRLNYFNEARSAFLKLKELDESFGKEIQQLEKQIKDRQKVAQEKQKKIYQGFFK